MTTSEDALIGLGCAPELAAEIAKIGGFGTASATLAAAGTSQATGAVLSPGISVVSSATWNSAGSLTLPTTAVIGQRFKVINSVKTPVKIYPPLGGNFIGRPTNLELFLKGGGFVELTKVSATLWAAEGDQVSNAFESWVHLETTISNVATFATVYTQAVAEQQAIGIDGNYSGAYVGKSTAATVLEGRFSGAVYRSASGSATVASKLGYFQDGSGADATTLINSSPPVTLVALADAENTTGLYETHGSLAADVVPGVRVNVSSNNLIVEAKGVTTDTVVIYSSFRVREWAGQ